MKAQMNWLFARRGVNTKGTGLIQLEVYLGKGSRKMISTGVRVKRSEWDKKRNYIKLYTPHLLKVHETLEEFRQNLEEFEMSIIRKGRIMSKADLDEYIAGNSVLTLNSFIDKEITADESLKYNTKKQQRTTLGKLNKFNPMIKFNQVNYSLVKDFDSWLRAKKLHPNTVADHHKVIRRYIYAAIKKELLKDENNPYHGRFKLKRELTSRVSLSEDEIRQIEELEYPEGDKLVKIRDMFLFSIYTGLRWSDLQNLQKDHLQKTAEGWEIALHKMVKVPQPVFLPLHLLFDGKAQGILEKYLSEDAYIFPRITNQKANLFLKDVIFHAKITKCVTWHTARHTFGSILAGHYRDPLLIGSLMGHSDIKTSMIYIHTSQEIIKSKLKSERY